MIISKKKYKQLLKQRDDWQQLANAIIDIALRIQKTNEELFEALKEKNNDQT